jgi:hypothetical protein
MLVRLALLALAIYGIYRWRRWRRSRARGRDSAGSDEAPPGTAQPIIPCRRCGTFVPRDQALPGPGHRIYCSGECRDADNR